MSDEINKITEINFASVQDKWDKVLQNYGQSESMMNAFGRAYENNPFVQNNRLKQIKSVASKYSREQIENMLANPDNNEDSLRRASHYFDNTIYPISKINNMYADILTYRNYINTIKVNNPKILVYEYEKLAKKKKALDIERTFRNITYQSMVEGKRFYYLREEGDAVSFQPMQSEYMKIVGLTDKGWQCAINMMVFFLPGVSLDQFAPEFKDFADEFFNVYDKDTNKMNSSVSNIEGVEAYNVGKIWYFWKFLPVDKCFAWGLNDSEPTINPILSGMFLSASELSAYQFLEQELLSLPLKSLLTAEVAMSKEGKSGNYNNDTSLTPDLIQLYQSIIQTILPSTCDFIAAPMNDFTLHTFPDVASRNNITGSAIQNFYSQSGVSGIVNTTDKPNVSMVKNNQRIEVAFVGKIYNVYNSFLRNWVKTMAFKNEFEVIVDGNIFFDDEKLLSVEKGLTTGNKSLYNQYLSFFKQDLNTAKGNMETVDAFGLYRMMEPLVSAYQNSDSGSDKKTGRPQKSGEDLSDSSGSDNGSNVGRIST